MHAWVCGGTSSGRWSPPVSAAVNFLWRLRPKARVLCFFYVALIMVILRSCWMQSGYHFCSTSLRRIGEAALSSAPKASSLRPFETPLSVSNFRHLLRSPNVIPDLERRSESISVTAIHEARDAGPLPALAESSAPWHHSWENSIAVCVSVAGENITDVREWLLYYRWLGVDHVFLTENSPQRELKSDLQDFVDSSFMTYAWEPYPQAQMMVYYRCMQQRHKYNWIAFLDSDEFLVVRQPNVTLKALLNEYRHFPGLAVHWIMVGPNGRDSRPHHGGVLRHYTTCAAKAHHSVKMIANTYYLANLRGHPHNFEFRGMAVAVNEGRHPLPWRYGLRPLCNRTDTPAPQCHLTPGSDYLAVPDQISAGRIALYHFVTRSREDFETKRRRAGGLNPQSKPWSFFDTISRQTQSSSPICSEPSKVASSCCNEADYQYHEDGFKDDVQSE